MQEILIHGQRFSDFFPGIDNVPEPIRLKFFALLREIDVEIFSPAVSFFKTQLPENITFRFRGTSGGKVPDALTAWQRSQSASFIFQYEHLPQPRRVHLIQKGTDWFMKIEDITFIRAALNEFRPLIMNQNDSIFFTTVHNVWAAMLNHADPDTGTNIRVVDSDNRDVTSIFIKYLGEHRAALLQILSKLDLDYLYNGLLQHSDEQLSGRLFRDYISGELNYILLKNYLILPLIKNTLAPYHQLLNIMTFPTLGPL